MNFKPIDEMSLRQLFSTDYAKEQLRLSYLGPVINESGRKEESPDALILDMRNSPYRIKRCEFKYCPSSVGEFSDNGVFDIAVMWNVSGSLTKEKLRSQILENHGCSEIILMAEYRAFNMLPEFSYERFSSKELVDDKIRKIITKRDLPSVIALYIAAKSFPSLINGQKVVDYLARKFPSVAQMQPQGRGNIIGAFVQTNPPLIDPMNLNNYRISITYDPILMASFLEQILRQNFLTEPPSQDDIQSLLR